MVRFGAALFLGRMLPRWSRDRVFEAAYHELLADYLEPSDGAGGPQPPPPSSSLGRLWRRTPRLAGKIRR